MINGKLQKNNDSIENFKNVKRREKLKILFNPKIIIVCHA